MNDQRRSPAFQFYADDFFAGTADMSQAEVGAYIRLLCHQWNRGSIPVGTEKLERLAGGSVSDEVLLKFPVGEDGARKNARLELEREKQNRYREMQREKGIASGKARHFNHGSTTVQPSLNHGSTAVEIRLEPEGNSPSPSPSPSPSQIPTPKPKRRPDGLRDEEMERAGIVGGIFRRKPETAWSDKEVSQFRKYIMPMPQEDLDLLVWYYEQPDAEYKRHDLATMLNNVPSELDRARKHKNRPPSLFDGANGVSTPNGNGGAVKPNGELSANMQAMLWTKQLDEVSNKMTVIKDTYSGLQSWSESDVEKYKALLARKKELKAKLGIQI